MKSMTRNIAGAGRGTRRAPHAVAAAALLLASVSTGFAEPAFDHDRAQWSNARLKATKLFKSMHVEIGISEPTDATVEAELITHDRRKLLAPNFPVIGLSYTTDGLGRHNDIDLLVEPDSGQVLQRISHETGKRYKYRVYRFARNGTLRRTRRPNPGEEQAGPDGWMDRSEQYFKSPVEVRGQPLTEPGTLIYLISTSDLQHPSDRFEMTAFSTSDETIYRIEAIVLDPERLDYEYELADGTKRKGKTEAIRVAIRGKPLAGGDDGNLTLLGMKDVELMLDPATRAPLALTGRVAVFGRISFDLDRLELRR
jgi:hypothetical protein